MIQIPHGHRGALRTAAARIQVMEQVPPAMPPRGVSPTQTVKAAGRTRDFRSEFINRESLTAPPSHAKGESHFVPRKHAAGPQAWAPAIYAQM